MNTTGILISSMLIASGLQAQEAEVDTRIRTVAGLDVAQTKAFFNEIKRTVVSGDKRAVSGMIAYPTTVDLPGVKNKKVRTRAEFEANFEAIINQKVVKAVQDQAYANLFVNWRGVMIGNGEVWFTALKGPTGKFDQFRIIKVNN